jgi:hypothetical protein
MPENEKKSETTPKPEQTERKGRELNVDELDRVTGGARAEDPPVEVREDPV